MRNQMMYAAFLLFVCASAQTKAYTPPLDPDPPRRRFWPVQAADTAAFERWFVPRLNATLRIGRIRSYIAAIEFRQNVTATRVTLPPAMMRIHAGYDGSLILRNARAQTGSWRERMTAPSPTLLQDHLMAHPLEDGRYQLSLEQGSWTQVSLSF